MPSARSKYTSSGRCTPIISCKSLHTSLTSMRFALSRRCKIVRVKAGTHTKVAGPGSGAPP